MSEQVQMRTKDGIVIVERQVVDDEDADAIYRLLKAEMRGNKQPKVLVIVFSQ